MTENRKKLVYIASPYSGNVTVNTEFARKACLYAVLQGNVPLAPHLLFPQFLDNTDPAQRQIGIEMGCELLHHCKEIWLCGPCTTAGMRVELDYAVRLGLPVRRVTCEEVYAGLGSRKDEIENVLARG